MKRSVLLGLLLMASPTWANQVPRDSSKAVSFGEGGQIKMLYDARQRPQAVYLNDKLHIVFNAGGLPGDQPKAKTKSMAVTYDPLTRDFSKIVAFDVESRDHHDGPVIWADREQRLHVLYDWHNTLGQHVISNQPGSIGSSFKDWIAAPVPAQEMAYPWMCRIYDDQQLVFYRTSGHYSSWTYRTTGDNGQTWEGPENDVLNLDIHGGMETDWSIYTAKAVSRDGNTLHVGFIAYDDYKRPRSVQELASGRLDKRRQQNPLYDNRRVNYKYNLYYVKVDLQTHRVMNYEGKVLQTPIDLSTANSKCRIWDTKWRGSGIVPSMMVGEQDQVSFLHNLSNNRHEESLEYHYMRFEHGEWKHNRITDSNHEWNSGHLAKSADGVLHAYVITGEGYFDSKHYMDKHGGGNIEEWTSADNGNTWNKARDLTPDRSKYPGWKFNNVQPVTRPDGSCVEGMLLFYGWKDRRPPGAQAFLLHEDPETLASKRYQKSGNNGPPQ